MKAIKDIFSRCKKRLKEDKKVLFAVIAAIVVIVVLAVLFVPIARSPMYHQPDRMEIYRYDHDITFTLTHDDPAFDTIYHSLKRGGATYSYHLPGIFFGKDDITIDSHLSSVWLSLYQKRFNPSEHTEVLGNWEDYIIVRAYYDEVQTVPQAFGIRAQHEYKELVFVLPGTQTPIDNILEGNNEVDVAYQQLRLDDGENQYVWRNFNQWHMPKRAIQVIEDLEVD